ncbi:hypothetical protein TNCV_981991 [Trichonephila clavipes]|nr:hypothetical protein TNCV_981991 [Trichonephila clavipes]
MKDVQISSSLTVKVAQTMVPVWLFFSDTVSLRMTSGDSTGQYPSTKTMSLSGPFGKYFPEINDISLTSRACCTELNWIKWRHYLSPAPQFRPGNGMEENILQHPAPVVYASNTHKIFRPTDLTCTYSVCSREVLGGIGHRQTLRSEVRCSSPVNSKMVYVGVMVYVLFGV